MTTPATEMRLAYLASEHAPGGQLIIDAPSQYSITDQNGAGLLGPAATLTTTRTFLQSADPIIGPRGVFIRCWSACPRVPHAAR